MAIPLPVSTTRDRQASLRFVWIETKQLGEGTVHVHEIGPYIPREQARLGIRSPDTSVTNSVRHKWSSGFLSAACAAAISGPQADPIYKTP